MLPIIFSDDLFADVVTNCDNMFVASFDVLAFCDDIFSFGMDIANCDFQFSNSSLFNWNIKSSGKRSILRFTCSLRRPVSTPYNRAKSRSSITCLPRITWMRFSMFSNGWIDADSTFAISFFLAILWSITGRKLRPVRLMHPIGCKVTTNIWNIQGFGLEMQIYLYFFSVF